MHLSKAQADALGIEIVGNRARIRRDKPQTPTKRAAGTKTRGNQKKSLAQALLAERLHALFGERLQTDYVGAVPGRRFEIDLALPDIRFGIEVDGWEFHGKHKASFLRDREKDWLAQLNDWQIVRLAHSRIMKESDVLIEQIQRLIESRAKRLACAEAIEGNTDE